ncbi:MAG: YIP1 family protein [Chthoniobacterales bacterium]
MANIHINRSGTALGIFPKEEVSEGLKTARFLPTDLAWREGMATWLPLSQFPEFAPAGAPPPPSGTIPSATPPLQVSTTDPVEQTGLPWDRRQELGLFNAFVETLKLVLMNPSIAFAQMKTEGGVAEPLIYAVIGGSVGFVVYFLFSMVFSSLGMMSHRNPIAGLMGFGLGAIFMVLFVPVFLALGLFIGSGILHLCLMLVGGAKRSYEATFRVICFAAGSAYPLMIVPICGGLISGIWCLVLECIGLTKAHDTSTGKAVLAVFLPLVVCCGGGFLIAITFGVLGSLAGHH